MHNNKKLKNTYHVIVALFLPHYLRECCEILSNPKLVHLINWCLPIWPRALHIFYGKKILLSNFQNKNVWKQAWKTSDSEVHYCYCNNEKLSYTYWWHCIFYTSPIFKSINYHHPAWLSELTNPWDLVFFILCCSKWRPRSCAWFEPPWFKLPLVQYNLSAWWQIFWNWNQSQGGSKKSCGVVIINLMDSINFHCRLQ